MAGILFSGWTGVQQSWIRDTHEKYDISYTSTDRSNVREYRKLVDNGIRYVGNFFAAPYQKKFDVFVHPGRHSLDSTWQKDWGMPEFKSECWMVASGVAARLDMISPKAWDREGCEHEYADAKKTQDLITHELVHVFHGQHNASPDFSNTEGIDWFVEGLATYASGQLDSTRVREVSKAISENKIPKSLGEFWTGNMRYGLSGSMVSYIDSKYGRKKLSELLPFNRNNEILAALNIKESELLEEWKKFMQVSHKT